MTINAYKLMVESSDVGELINPDCDDDDELDRIKHMTTLALKQRIPHGGTVHDAAKALVALQYSKKPNDCLGTNPRSDPSSPHPRSRPKPRIVLLPPKKMVEPSASGHQTAPQTSPQALTKKPRGRRNGKRALAEVEAVEQDPGSCPALTGQRTQQNTRQKHQVG